MSAELYIKGKKVENVTEFSVDSSIGTLCNSFSVKIALDENVQNFNEHSFLKFKEGESAVIKVDDTEVINGFIDEVNVEYDKKKHEILIYGRDRTADFVDSSVGPTNVEGPIDLERFIRLVLDGMNLQDIEVINLLPSSADTEIRATKNLSSEIGQTGFEFVNEFAKLKQVLLRGDGDGNILMSRGGGDQRIFANLINLPGDNRSNILSGSYRASMYDRFNTYTFVSQEDYSALGADPDDGTANLGIVTDPSVRSSRSIIIEPEENSTSAECLDAAAWEANLQRARSKGVIYTVAGHSISETNPLSTLKPTLWEINSIIGVVDIFSNIDSKMLVESLSFKLSEDAGNTTEISLVPPDSYRIEAAQDAKEARTSIIGKEDDF